VAAGGRVGQDDEVVQSSRKVVADGYDRIGSRYRDWSGGGTVRLRFVQALLSRLPAGSTMVDLGCGPGEPATRLLSSQHRVLGVDVSPVQVDLARAAAPAAAFVIADITQFALRAESVDAVTAFYAFGHLPPAAHAPLLRSIAGWLRPGGILLTSTPATAGEDIDSDWLGVPMYFGGIGPAATADAVTAAGLRVEAFEPITEDEGNGQQTFHWLTAYKPLP
jgi:SAM-dependent methyltransferase